MYSKNDLQGGAALLLFQTRMQPAVFRVRNWCTYLQGSRLKDMRLEILACSLWELALKFSKLGRPNRLKSSQGHQFKYSWLLSCISRCFYFEYFLYFFILLSSSFLKSRDFAFSAALLRVGQSNCGFSETRKTTV